MDISNINETNEITNIYNYYIKNSVATFEEQQISAQTIVERIAKIQKLNLPWLVAYDVQNGNEQLLGYAYASQFRERSAYRFTCETTVYLAPNKFKQGFGTDLYQVLFTELKNRGLHSAVACITIPNPQSTKFHEKMGMTKIAHFSEVGFKFGKWLDVGYWQKMF